MKSTNAALAMLAALFIALPCLEAEEGEEAEKGTGAFADDKLSLYGYIINYSNAELGDERGATGLGDILYLRMKGDFRPQEGLFFHVEANYDARMGNQNPLVLAQDYGFAAPAAVAYAAEPEIDHAWGSAVFGDLSLQFGKIPIGWGSAYVFNPTERASRPALLDPVYDETPGTLAFMPAWSPSDALRLSGYAAFQDKSHRDTVALRDGAWENLPFAVRLQSTLGNFDLSASLIKEVEYIEDSLTGAEPYRRAWFAGLDCAGAIWNFGVYAEAALRLPAGDRGLSWEPDGFALKDALEMALGFDYMFSDIKLELRAEYYHQGSGESDSDRYYVISVINGEKLVQAEDYLYGRLEKTFADYFKLDLGGLVNLNDASAVAMTELAYEAADNLELKLGATLPWGPSGSEFDGRYDLTTLGFGAFDLMKASVFASCKLSF